MSVGTGSIAVRARSVSVATGNVSVSVAAGSVSVSVGGVAQRAAVAAVGTVAAGAVAVAAGAVAVAAGAVAGTPVAAMVGRSRVGPVSSGVSTVSAESASRDNSHQGSQTQQLENTTRFSNYLSNHFRRINIFSDESRIVKIEKLDFCRSYVVLLNL